MSLNSLAYNPITATYAQARPYISVSEFRTSAQAFDTNQLVVGGDQQAQDDALADLIAQASSAVDSYCNQPIAATYQTQSQVTQVKPSTGSVSLVCRNKPVLEAVSISVGVTPATVAPVTSGANIVFTNGVISVPALSLPVWGTPAVFALWTYISGYAHTFLVADAQAGDQHILVAGAGGEDVPVPFGSSTWSYDGQWPFAVPGVPNPVTTNPLGIYPGSELRIHDGAFTQTVFVDASYSGGPLLPLVQGLSRDVVVPDAPDFVSVTAVPDAVRRATVLLTSMLLKDRGDSAMVLSGVSSPEFNQYLSNPGAGSDAASVRALLTTYKRAT